MAKKKKKPARRAKPARAPKIKAKPKARPKTAKAKSAPRKKVKAQKPRPAPRPKAPPDTRPMVEVLTIFPDGTLHVHGAHVGRDERLVGRLIVREATWPSRYLVPNWDVRTKAPIDGRMVLKAGKKKGKPLYHWQKKNLPPEAPLLTLTPRAALLPDGRQATAAEALEAVVNWAVSLDVVRMAAPGYSATRMVDTSPSSAP